MKNASAIILALALLWFGSALALTPEQTLPIFSKSGINQTALDGATTVTSCSSSGTACTTGGLTTTHTNDFIVLFVNYNNAANSIVSITDTAGLTWTLRANFQPNPSSEPLTHLAEYTAPAPSTLAADAISANFTTSNCCQQVGAFAISGVNLSAPFDPNPFLPVGISSQVVGAWPEIYTYSPAAFVFSWIGNFTGTGCITGAGAGWTLISNDSGIFNIGQYQLVSSTRRPTVASATYGTPCAIHAAIGDAVVSK